MLQLLCLEPLGGAMRLSVVVGCWFVVSCGAATSPDEYKRGDTGIAPRDSGSLDAGTFDAGSFDAGTCGEEGPPPNEACHLFINGACQSETQHWACSSGHWLCPEGTIRDSLCPNELDGCPAQLAGTEGTMCSASSSLECRFDAQDPFPCIGGFVQCHCQWGVWTCACL